MLGASRISYLAQGAVAAGSSLRSNTISAFGDVQHTNYHPYSQFGNSSAMFDGTGDYIKVEPETAGDFIFNGAFTFEFWFRYDNQRYPNSVNLLSNKIGSGTASTDFFILLRNYDKKIQIYCANDMNVAAASGVLATDTWHHLCLVFIQMAQDNKQLQILLLL